MAPRILRGLLCVVMAFAVSSAAHASSCRIDLDQLTGVPLHGELDGSSAASWLAAATVLAEPALPAWERWNAGGVRDETVDPAVGFLADRGLLPGEGDPFAALPDGVFLVLDRLLESFGGRPVQAVDRSHLTSGGLRHAIETTLRQVRDLVRPAAVLVWTEDRELALRGLVWNWSSFPRLVLFPPDLEGSAPVTRAAAIASMENCVREIDHWFSVDEATARRLLTQETGSRLIVVGTEPDRPDLSPWWVPAGDELEVLAYEHPAVRDLDAFSVVFTGAPMPFTAWLRLLPNVRTNASPIDLRRYLQTPPSAGDR